MFSRTKKIEPIKETLDFLTNDDEVKTRAYLLRHLRDYVEWNENDPEHITMVCRIVDALKRLEGE